MKKKKKKKTYLGFRLEAERRKELKRLVVHLTLLAALFRV